METHLQKQNNRKASSLVFHSNSWTQPEACFWKMKAAKQNICSPGDANMKPRQNYYREKWQLKEKKNWTFLDAKLGVHFSWNVTFSEKSFHKRARRTGEESKTQWNWKGLPERRGQSRISGEGKLKLWLSMKRINSKGSIRFKNHTNTF